MTFWGKNVCLDWIGNFSTAANQSPITQPIPTKNNDTANMHTNLPDTTMPKQILIQFSHTLLWYSRHEVLTTTAMIKQISYSPHRHCCATEDIHTVVTDTLWYNRYSFSRHRHCYDTIDILTCYHRHYDTIDILTCYHRHCYDTTDIHIVLTDTSMIQQIFI